MSYATTDLSDAHPDADVLEPILTHFGGTKRFAGRVRTLAVFEDNGLVRAALETPGEGAVLVVDGGGSLRCALVGGNLGVLALQNGWAGLIVNGCVRDTAELGATAVGVLALAAHPRKSIKRNVGRVDEPVRFGGVTFWKGAWLAADEDGVIVADGPLTA